MEDSETELTSNEPDALGADFITVELDTQPIEYVVKWAEVGSKFTISCVKKEADEDTALTTEQLKVVEADETFFAPYEEVYPVELTEQSVEIKTDSDEEEEDDEDDDDDDDDEDEEDGHTDEAGGSQLDIDAEAYLDQVDYDPDERQYRCNYCGKCYSHPSSLYRHQQTHTGKAAPAPSKPPPSKPGAKEQRYTCPHCGMTFKGSRMLGSHLRLHGKRRIHPCNICGKEFNHSSSLSRHRLVHKKGKGVPKDVGTPPSMGHMRRPLKTGNKLKKAKRQRQQAGGRPRKQLVGTATTTASPPVLQGGEKFYACTQCDMTFRTSTMLSKHQVTHVKELLDNYTPGKENLGETSSDLKIRLKLCSRDKPNFYTLCKKNRRRRGGKASGKRGGGASASASGALPPGVGGGEDGKGALHACEQCGKRFSHASGLARHHQTHRADGPRGKFTCGYCAKGFGRRAELQLHEKSHALPSGKTYMCAACNKTFVHSSSYSRHKKAHAQEEERERAAARRKGGVAVDVDETAPLETDSE